MTRWDMARLPELRGAMRQSVLKFSDVGVFSEAVVGSNPFRCRLVCMPDPGRQAGTRLQLMNEFQQATFPGLPKGEIPNDWASLLSIVEKKYGKGSSK